MAGAVLSAKTPQARKLLVHLTATGQDLAAIGRENAEKLIADLTEDLEDMVAEARASQPGRPAV